MVGKKIAIVGHGSTGLMAHQLASLQSENPDVEIITLGEAKNRELTKTYKITNPYPKLEFDEIPITRAERRKNKRQKGKK